MLFLVFFQLSLKLPSRIHHDQNHDNNECYYQAKQNAKVKKLVKLFTNL